MFFPCRTLRLTLASLVLLALCAAPRAAQAALDRKAVTRISTTVFEVVALKPTVDSLSYERPLPLELLPYQERTDKYRSLGTAFTITPGEYISAAHVFGLDEESELRDFFIRDASGQVYPVDQILRYSERRDFLVFSVQNRPPGAVLGVNRAPEVNGKVYAVGNALGDGVVIRDGLYTSNTPEELNGDWKWLRFSAAASPGNSGGPLLDEDGRVIGIIERKSPNENLNIALPIDEALRAPANQAHLFKRMVYGLDNLPMTKVGTLDQVLSLPLTCAELRSRNVAIVAGFAQGLLDQLLAENREQIFPRGKESLPVFFKTFADDFPQLLTKGSDGNWDAQSAKETKTFDLDQNASITMGMIGRSLALSIRKPDDVALASFYADSKLLMDLILKGVAIHRQVGVDKVKITSLGPARRSFTHQDAYGRKWQANAWVLEYSDEALVTFSLPVPGGCITLLRWGHSGQIDDQLLDLRTLSDFIQLAYSGNLWQWREFLATREILPTAFAKLRLDVDPGAVGYRSQRMAFHIDSQLLDFSERSRLRLNFGYVRDGAEVVWDVREIVLREDDTSATGFTISRNAAPPAELGDKYRTDWERLVARKQPYDRKAFQKDKTTLIETVYPAITDATAQILYTVAYTQDGTVPEPTMNAKLDILLQRLAVFEGKPSGNRQP